MINIIIKYFTYYYIDLISYILYPFCILFAFTGLIEHLSEGHEEGYMILGKLFWKV